MFPAPIERSSPPKRYLYYAAVVVALVAWLLPLLAVLLTSIRSAEDLEYGKLLGLAQGVEIFKLHRDLPGDAIGALSDSTRW